MTKLCSTPCSCWRVKIERGEALTEEDVAGIEVSEEAAAKEEAEAELDRGISAIQKLRKGRFEVPPMTCLGRWLRR